MDSKVVWVVGSTGLLGNLIAIELCKVGHKVIFHGKNREVVVPPGSMFVKGDCRSLLEMKNLSSKIVHEFHSLDFLVCCVGGREWSYPSHTDISANLILDSINNNLITVFNCVQASLEHMPSGGKIVILGSDRVKRLGEGGGMNAYIIAKAALHQYSICLARELEPRNIKVNCVLPGKLKRDEFGNFISFNIIDCVLNTLKSESNGKIIQVD
jgi:3-oxoacyl-[acyl-carrier protein] reductase